MQVHVHMYCRFFYLHKLTYLERDSLRGTVDSARHGGCHKSFEYGQYAIYSGCGIKSIDRWAWKRKPLWVAGGQASSWIFDHSRSAQTANERDKATVVCSALGDVKRKGGQH